MSRFKNIQRHFTYLLIGLAVWLVDAASFAYFNGDITVLGALFTQVPFYRLSLRIFIVLLLILWASIKNYGRKKEEQTRLGIWQAEPKELAEAVALVSEPAQKIEQVPIAQKAEIAILQPKFSQPKRKQKTTFKIRIAKNPKMPKIEEKSERLWQYAARISQAMHLVSFEQNNIRTLCYCYDIGRIGLVPSKEGQINLFGQEQELREEEKEDTHAEIGARIISGVPALAGAENLVRYHHERWDGSGLYALKGEEIPLGVRIFTVAWVYDALTCPAQGRKPMKKESALEALYAYGGTVLDPDVVAVFIRIMGRNGFYVEAGSQSLALKS